MMDLNENKRPSFVFWGKELFWLLFRSWSMPFSRGLRGLQSFFASLSIFQILFLLASCLMMLFAAPHWLSYSVDLNGSGVYTIGSDIRIFCFSGGLLGIFFAFVRIPYRLFVYSIYMGSLFITFILGFFFPNLIHAEFSDAGDLHLRLGWIFSWAGAFLLALATAPPSLASPLLDYTKIYHYLFADR